MRTVERRLAVSTVRIGVATADLYPTIDPAAAVTSVAASLSSLGSAATRTWSVGPLATGLFTNRSAARIQAARSDADADLASVDGSVLSALKDVELALSGLAADHERPDARQAAGSRDGRALVVSDERFRRGAIGFIDLLDAQRTLMADGNALALASHVIAADEVQLFKALGSGWWQEPVGRMNHDQVSATHERWSVCGSLDMAWIRYRPTGTIAACRLD